MLAQKFSIRAGWLLILLLILHTPSRSFAGCGDRVRQLGGIVAPPADRHEFWTFPVYPVLHENTDWAVSDHQVRVDHRVVGALQVETVRLTQGSGVFPAKLHRDGNQLFLVAAWPANPELSEEARREREAHPSELAFPRNTELKILAVLHMMHETGVHGPNDYGPVSQFGSNLNLGFPLTVPKLVPNRNGQRQLLQMATNEGLLILDQNRKAAAKFALENEARRG